MVGLVHSIETFSTLDGPGIRTVIFLQGCHLRCQYCQNPDTWDSKAATAREYSFDEIMQLICRSLPYIKASGGGVTFSGGEPFLQYDFIKEVFKECKKLKVHTAVDTSLYVSTAKVEELLPYIDLVLADIKQMDPEKSCILTGINNELNLANLRIINRSQVEIWIRYVVVPGITDDEQDVTAMADFVSGLEKVSRIDLLPYHTLGKHKWSLLGLDYKLENVSLPEPMRLKQLQDLVKAKTNKPVFIS